MGGSKPRIRPSVLLPLRKAVWMSNDWVIHFAEAAYCNNKVRLSRPNCWTISSQWIQLRVFKTQNHQTGFRFHRRGCRRFRKFCRINWLPRQHPTWTENLIFRDHVFLISYELFQWTTTNWLPCSWPAGKALTHRVWDPFLSLLPFDVWPLRLRNAIWSSGISFWRHCSTSETLSTSAISKPLACPFGLVIILVDPWCSGRIPLWWTMYNLSNSKAKVGGLQRHMTKYPEFPIYVHPGKVPCGRSMVF